MRGRRRRHNSWERSTEEKEIRGKSGKGKLEREVENKNKGGEKNEREIRWVGEEGERSGKRTEKIKSNCTIKYCIVQWVSATININFRSHICEPLPDIGPISLSFSPIPEKAQHIPESLFHFRHRPNTTLMPRSLKATAQLSGHLHPDIHSPFDNNVR